MNGPSLRGACGLFLCMIAVAGMTVFGNLIQALCLRLPLSDTQGSFLGVCGIVCFIVSVICAAMARDLLQKNPTTLMGCILGALPMLVLICFLSGVSEQWLHSQMVPVLIAFGLLGALCFSAGTQAEAEKEDRDTREKKQEAKMAKAPELEEVIM